MESKNSVPIQVLTAHVWALVYSMIMFMCVTAHVRLTEGRKPSIIRGLSRRF